MRRTTRTRACFALAWVVLLLGAAGMAAPAAASGDRPPRVVQVSYGVWNTNPSHHQLYAFVRHSAAVRFVTRFGDRRAAASGWYKSHVTDLDIRGERARHPWAPRVRRGGRGVHRLVWRSLRRRGFANVRVVSAGNGSLEDAVARIVVRRCHRDPPLYPLSCEVRPVAR